MLQEQSGRNGTWSFLACFLRLLAYLNLIYIAHRRQL